MKSNILITGIAGLIGSKFAQYIIDNYIDEYTVIGVDSLLGGSENNIPKDAIFYKMDVCDSELSMLFDKYKFKYVFHFAAYAAEGLSGFKRNFFHTNNILSTGNIINNCINYNVERLVFTSSMSVYGDHGEKTFDENDIPKPLDPYAIGKYTSELDIQSAGNQFDLDWCIVRPHNVYGPNQNIWDKYRNVLGIWMRQILNGEPTTIYGEGDSVRAFTYIDDILPCLLTAATSDKCSKQIINLGGTIGYTIKEANDILKDVVNCDVETIYLEKRYEVKHAVPTYEKSIEYLHFKDNTLLKDGLTKMWEWVKQQQNKDVISWDDFEILKNLYSYWQ
jgi:UDP-glucose 4-epimerase